MKNLIIALFVLTSLSVKAQPKQGMQAFEISLPSLNGDTINLSSLKGKVVLLDFWASWCKPCRSANKKLSNLYPKFKDKGFEIFAVSMDKEKTDWKNAVKQDKASWIQVLNGSGFESKLAEQWELFAIPTSFLIDKDGKLVAMDLEEKELEKAIKLLIDK
jgi:peroxiredoxin